MSRDLEQTNTQPSSPNGATTTIEKNTFIEQIVSRGLPKPFQFQNPIEAQKDFETKINRLRIPPKITCDQVIFSQDKTPRKDRSFWGETAPALPIIVETLQEAQVMDHLDGNGKQNWHNVSVHVGRNGFNAVSYTHLTLPTKA